MSKLKSVSINQMRNIDSTAIQDYGIPRIVLMEHAGLEVAKATVKLLKKENKDRIFVFSGTGYNGGDGLVAARHLFNWGYEIVIYMVGKEEKCKKETLSNFNILKKLKVEINYFRPNEASTIKRRLSRNAVVIDSILGIGIKGKVRSPIDDLIKCLNSSKAPILSVDVPSGLNSDSGEILGVCIKASETVTFAAPKKGFFREDGPKRVGEVTLEDIGIPEKVIREKSK